MSSTVTGNRIVSALRQWAPNARIKILDSHYHVLSPTAPAQLHREWISAAWSRDLIAWQMDRADCDDWAWLFRAWCLHRHIITSGRKNALAVGYLHYTAPEGYHAANLHVVARPGPEDIWKRIEFQPLEPQPHGGPIELSETERTSIDLILI